jgi:hypothetical protein
VHPTQGRSPDFLGSSVWARRSSETRGDRHWIRGSLNFQNEKRETRLQHVFCGLETFCPGLDKARLGEDLALSCRAVRL